MNATILMLGLLLGQPDATPAGARELAHEGQRLYKEHQYAEAVAKFEAALALRPSAALHFNIAKCRVELGQTARALAAYREYLRLSPQASDRATVETAVSALKQALAQGGVQQLQIVTHPVNATIEVDAVAAGTTPLYIELSPGPHRIAISAIGFLPRSKEVLMRLDRFEELDVELEAVRDTRDAPALNPPPVPPLVAGVEEPAPPVHSGRKWTWVSLGTAVVSSGFGLGFGVAANGGARNLTSAIHPRAEGDLLVGRVHQLALGADVSWGFAVGTAVLAVVLFFVEGRE